MRTSTFVQTHIHALHTSTDLPRARATQAWLTNLANSTRSLRKGPSEWCPACFVFLVCLTWGSGSEGSECRRQVGLQGCWNLVNHY